MNRSSLRAGSGRAGFSLPEVIVSLTILGVIITGTLSFMDSQNRAFQDGLKRMGDVQTARFTIQIMEEDIVTAGTNVPREQPALVVAGADVIAFSTDYASNIANDLFAVFYDPNAATGQVTAPKIKVTTPNTSFGFPDTLYYSGAANSPAELLVFYFRPDSTTSRTDDYVLLRRVNNGTAELVSRNLLKVGTLPFFRYFKPTGTTIDTVAANLLPLLHTVKIHKSATDTGSVARVDSVRAVRISIRATNGLTGSEERTADISRIVRMPNLGQEVLRACGSQPILGQTLGATVATLATGEKVINLNWNRATDEVGGEGDVIRYVIWRRISPDTDWGDPFLSFPAGQTSYTYQDKAVTVGKTYTYLLAAQDCTPRLSTTTQSPSRTP